MALSPKPLAQTGEKASPSEVSAVQGEKTAFLHPFMHRRTAVAHPEATKAFLKLSRSQQVHAASVTPIQLTHYRLSSS